INNEDLDESDQYTTTALLAAYFEDKEYDIILGGNVSNDNSTGQIGPRLAEKLGIAYVTTITKLDIDGTTATMERDVEGDMEVVEAQLPLLVTAQQGLNEP
ncbi:electron transfer flavoprotein subunit beta, partial [Staphylococcus sp. SIMBA_130]